MIKCIFKVTYQKETLVILSLFKFQHPQNFEVFSTKILIPKKICTCLYDNYVCFQFVYNIIKLVSFQATMFQVYTWLDALENKYFFFLSSIEKKTLNPKNQSYFYWWYAPLPTKSNFFSYKSVSHQRRLHDELFQ